MCKVLYESWSKLAKNNRPTCFLARMQSFMVTSCFSTLKTKNMLKRNFKSIMPKINLNSTKKR